MEGASLLRVCFTVFFPFSSQKINNYFKFLISVLREYEILAAGTDPDENFDDFAAVINFITGAPERGEVSIEAYMDYTIESTYTEVIYMRFSS